MANTKEKSGKISVQLLLVMIPMIAFFIVLIAVIIFANATSVITDEATNGLSKESKANANDISKEMNMIRGYYNGMADSLEEASLDKAGIKKVIMPGKTEFPDLVNDVYVALSDKSFIDAADWEPDEGYDPTTRGWYVSGHESSSIVFGKPDIDLDTKEMVVNGSRRVAFKDGKDGVLSTDILLKSVSTAVSEYTPLGKGKSMLFAGPTIIGSPTADYVGADVTTLTSDSFIQSIYAEITAGHQGSVASIKNNKGKDYYVSIESIEGTDWTLVSYVSRADVLQDLNRLGIITVAMVLAMLIVSTLIILFLVRTMITKPVNNLTNTIIRIAEGDFTVNIARGGNNEIGIMNNRMGDYVDRMRDTLGEMKKVTNDLADESENSMNAAKNMSEQAERQSQSMEQIHDAMEGVAQSVTELATNATELAQSVSDMTEQGGATRKIMDDLVEKARKGQQDMDHVQENMGTISVSMTEMNDIVVSVDEAANKINTIVEMINSISSQTNLLSLNASIEAARAGEAGRGFAVVATEIGNLANDSANATTEIGTIIKDITEQIKTLTDHSQASMEEIAKSSEAVSDTSETFTLIFEALNKAGSTVNDMVGKMDKVSDIAATVAAIAEEQSASTEEVTATVEVAAVSAQSVAEESRSVDDSAATVAESSNRIGAFVDTFII